MVPADGPDQAAVVGLAGQEGRAVVEDSPVPPAPTSDVLMVRTDTAPSRIGDRRSRPGPWTRLAALVTGRRRLAGRHRPGEVPVRGWSMFAPSGRRPGRRRTL